MKLTYITIAILGILLISIVSAGGTIVGGGGIIIGDKGGAICKTCPKPIEPPTCLYDNYDLPEIKCNGKICLDGTGWSYFQYYRGDAVSTCEMKRQQYLHQYYTNQVTQLKSDKGILDTVIGWFLR